MDCKLNIVDIKTPANAESEHINYKFARWIVLIAIVLHIVVCVTISCGMHRVNL